MKQIIDTFTITIKGQPGAYTIEATGSKGIRVDPQPFAWEPTSEQVATLAALAGAEAKVDPDAIRELGRALYTAIFAAHLDIATGFARLQGMVGRAKGVRLRLHLETPALAVLPWEAMHDGREFLSTKTGTPLVRLLPLPDDQQPPQRLNVRGPLRVLFVWVSPQGLPDLNIDRAATELHQLLSKVAREKQIVLEEIGSDIPLIQRIFSTIKAEVTNRRYIAFKTLLDPTLDELRSELRNGYHLLYFAGHGDANKGIYLDDGAGGEVDPHSGRRPAGDPYPVSAETLAQALEGKPTRLVFLAACNTAAVMRGESGLLTGFAQELAGQAKLPAIVAMQYVISEDQATPLTTQFFEGLAQFQPVDMALAEARKVLIRPSHPPGRDVISPVIYLQTKEGVLFQPARNWAVLGVTAMLPLLVFLSVLLIFVQQAAQLETTQRIVAETQQAIARVTAQAEATRRVIAEATRQVEATERAFAQSTAQAEATARVIEAQNRATAQAEAALQEQEAGRQRQVARARTLASQAQAIQAANGDLTPSILLAIESLRYNINSEANLLLQQRLDQLPPSKAQLEQEAEVAAAVFSPDHRLLSAATADGLVHIWDWAKAQEIARLRHAETIQRMVYSPDGRMLATLTTTGVWLWDVTTGQEIINIDFERQYGSLEISPDWQWLAASMSEDNVEIIKVWNLLTGQFATQLSPKAAVAVMSFSPDSQWLATGNTDGTAQLWKVISGRETQRVMHQGIVRMVIFSPDSKLIVSSGDDDNPVKVWEVATGQVVAEPNFGVQKVELARFTPDGQRLIIANVHAAAFSLISDVSGQTIAIWQTDDWKEVASLIAPVRDVFSFYPKGPLVASGGEEGLALWNSRTGEVIRRLKLPFYDIDQVSWDPFPGGKPAWIATVPLGGCRDEKCVDALQMWDIATGQPVAQIPSSATENSYYSFSPDGRYVARWDLGKSKIMIWALEREAQVTLAPQPMKPVRNSIFNKILFSPNGRWLAALDEPNAPIILWRFPPEYDFEPKIWAPDKDIGSGGWSLAFSPDNRWIISSGKAWEVETGREASEILPIEGKRLNAFSYDGRWGVSGTKVWDLETGRKISELPHTDQVDEAIFSPDGRWIMSIKGSTAIVWEAATGREVSRITDDSQITSFAFSPNSKLAMSRGATVKIWEVESGKELAQFDLEGPVSQVEFSSDWQQALTAGDNVVRVWEIPAWKEKARFEHDRSVKLATFSPDGKWVLSVGFDGKTYIWETATGQLVTELWQPSSLVVSAAFHPDGHRIAIVGDNSSFRVLLWQPEDLITEACSRLTRNLTLLEWGVYFGNEPYHPTCPNLPLP